MGRGVRQGGKSQIGRGESGRQGEVRQGKGESDRQGGVRRAGSPAPIGDHASWDLQPPESTCLTAKVRCVNLFPK